MNAWLSENEVSHLLSDGLAEIAQFAQFGYSRRGRGTVAILPAGDGNSCSTARYILRYLSYKNVPVIQGTRADRMIAAYNPASELVIQYSRACGKTRTIHMRAPSARRFQRFAFRMARIWGWLCAFLCSRPDDG